MAFRVFLKSVAKEALSLNCYSENEAAKTAKVSVSVMEHSENSAVAWKIYKKMELNRNFLPIDNDGTLNGNGFYNFLTHEELKNSQTLLSNGTLYLLIKMTVFGEEKTTRKPPSPHYISQEIGSIEIQERLKVTDHLKDSWINDDFSDVHIKCGGQIFYCHRIILAKRSQYFRSMLENGMMESKTRVISLDFMDVDVLKAVLRFIYGGHLDNLEQNAVDLIQASGMLILEDLKNICEKYLLENYMKLDNVIDMVVMAENHNASHLKKAAVEMIVANSDDIVKQDGWKEKLANSPMLLIQMFEAMATKKDH